MEGRGSHLLRHHAHLSEAHAVRCRLTHTETYGIIPGPGRAQAVRKHLRKTRAVGGQIYGHGFANFNVYALQGAQRVMQQWA